MSDGVLCYACASIAVRTRFVSHAYRLDYVTLAAGVSYFESVPVCRACDDELGRHPGVESHWEFTRLTAVRSLGVKP